MDQKFNGTENGTVGPVEQHLKSFQCKGELVQQLVFGAFGDVSEDFDVLVQDTATRVPELTEATTRVVVAGPATTRWSSPAQRRREWTSPGQRRREWSSPAQRRREWSSLVSAATTLVVAGLATTTLVVAGLATTGVVVADVAASKKHVGVSVANLFPFPSVVDNVSEVVIGRVGVSVGRCLPWLLGQRPRDYLLV